MKRAVPKDGAFFQCMNSRVIMLRELLHTSTCKRNKDPTACFSRLSLFLLAKPVSTLPINEGHLECCAGNRQWIHAPQIPKATKDQVRLQDGKHSPT